MPSVNHFISAMGRCSNLWRQVQLEDTGLDAVDVSYLFYFCRHPGCSQDEICRALFVNKSSVTRRLTYLESEGYVTREQSPTDRRTLLVSPTEKTLAIRPRLLETTKAWNAIITKGFDEQECAQFAALLERAYQNAKAGIKEMAE